MPPAPAKDVEDLERVKCSIVLSGSYGTDSLDVIRLASCMQFVQVFAVVALGPCWKFTIFGARRIGIRRRQADLPCMQT